MKSLHRPDLFAWSSFDEARNVDFTGHLLVIDGGPNVAFDPMPMSDHDLAHVEQLGGIGWILISNADHVRDAAALCKRFDAKVAAPGAERDRPEFAGLPVGLWLQPDEGLTFGVHCIGMRGSKTRGELAFVLPGGDTVLCGDLIRGQRAGSLNLLPDPKLKDKAAAVQSVQALAERNGIEAVLLGDGQSIFRDGGTRLRELASALTMLLLILTTVGCVRSIVRPPEANLEADPNPVESSVEAPVEAVTPTPLNTVVQFAGRGIDIEPHLQGFPYRGFQVSPHMGKLLYFHKGSDARGLRALPLDGELDLAAGVPVTDIDWNTRSLSRWEEIPGNESLLVIADEDNAEFFDVYRIDLADGGSIRKLTDVPYVYGFGLDMPRERFAYVARYPKEDRVVGFETCLEFMPLTGGEKEVVVCDTDALPFTWSRVTVAPDGSRVWMRANTENDRARGNLLEIDLGDDPVTVAQITEDVPRQEMGMLREWLDPDTFLYASDEGGFANLYEHNVLTREVRAITDHTDEVMNGARVLRSGDVTRLITTIRRPYETELQLIDLDGNVLATQVMEAGLYDLGHHGDSLWMYATSRKFKVDMFRLTLDSPDSFSVHPFVGMSEEDAAALVHCDIERIEVETFDGRKLHAYLSTPRVAPAEGERKLAAIVAFYGGGNYFDTTSQIYCEAGVTHLSPAVRGSWGFGQEFMQLNDGDLGGDEIVDLHYAAQWLVDNRGFAPRDIGVVGGSHGGYATMRALTFPPETNDRNSDFDFGWGVSFYGFSDIKTFWETCNIPDWVLLEAGDPATEPEKIRERSPLYHLDKLDSPILLLHGENDQRLPVQESRQFDEACKAASKDCTYIEFEGQGHGLKGLANQVRVWTSVFSFLSSTGLQ